MGGLGFVDLLGYEGKLLKLCFGVLDFSLVLKFFFEGVGWWGVEEWVKGVDGFLWQKLC